MGWNNSMKSFMYVHKNIFSVIDMQFIDLLTFRRLQSIKLKLCVQFAFIFCPKFQIEIFLLMIKFLKVWFVLLKPLWNSYFSWRIINSHILLKRNTKSAHESFNSSLFIYGVSAFFVVDVFGWIVIRVRMRDTKRCAINIWRASRLRQFCV